MDGVVPALVALTYFNAIVSVTAKDKDSPDKGWDDLKSVTDGTKSAGLAAVAWPGDSGPCNRVYAQLPSNPEVRELRWNAATTEWKLAEPLAAST